MITYFDCKAKRYDYIIQDGCVTIQSYHGNEKHIIIPDELGGYPVRKIGNSVFVYSGRMRSIKLPEGATSIGMEAMQNCDRMESVTLPRDLEEIGGGAFAGCTSLQQVILPEENTHFKCIDNVLYSKDMETLVAFTGGPSRRFVIPEHVTKIGPAAFQGCTLKIVKYPDNLKTIGQFAFWKSESLREVYCPEGLEVIEKFAFYECIRLKKVELPRKMDVIGCEAFANCECLTQVKMPQSITTLAKDAFYDTPQDESWEEKQKEKLTWETILRTSEGSK